MNAPQLIDSSAAEIQQKIQAQRDAFIKEGFVSAQTRIARLRKGIDLLIDNKELIVNTINKDFGNRSIHQSLMADIGSVVDGYKHNIKHLKKWMRSAKRSAPLPMNLFGARARIDYQPKGVVGILATWNFPVQTGFAPMGGVLAAGNRVVLKFSEVSPATALLMSELIPKYFDATEVTCVNGGPEVGAAFASQDFDHIVFTGAGSIGKLVMRAASEQLTPVTLELGGKSPVIICDDADIQDTAIRIMTGKALNMGQACLSPDYVFVQKHKLDNFIAESEKWVKEMFPTMLNNPDYTSVINERHRQRLQGYLEDAKQKGGDVREINPANEDFSQQTDTNKIPVTFVINPTDDMKVMQEEIFGPIIAIKSYETLDECIDYINAHHRPLGLYMFTRNVNTQNKILHNTLSGGVSINDVLMHASCEELPFGGVGPSGMGGFHGIEGFKEFSHARSIYMQSRINLQRLGGMLPPFGEQADKNLERMLKK